MRASALFPVRDPSAQDVDCAGEQPLVGQRNLIETATAKGVTPLFAAVIGNHVDCVRLLIDRGARVDVVNSAARRP